MNAVPEPTPPRPAPSPDPLIDEVREARRWVEQQYGGNIRDLAAALRKRQRERGRPIISDRGGPSKRAG